MKDEVSVSHTSVPCIKLWCDAMRKIHRRYEFVKRRRRRWRSMVFCELREFWRTRENWHDARPNMFKHDVNKTNSTLVCLSLLCWGYLEADKKKTEENICTRKHTAHIVWTKNGNIKCINTQNTERKKHRNNNK